jgi:hypothetical protein
MAILTFEQELLNAPTYENRQANKQPTGPSFSELLGILNYNQGLVEFADSKAGSLILLNSLLIAAVGTIPSHGEMGVFKLASVLLCSAAVYVCFQVISSKDEGDKAPGLVKRRKPQDWEQNDFLFFGCIGKYKTGDQFCSAFHQSTEGDRQNSLLQRTYVIAQIAQRKFSQYKTAQQITSVALAVWVAVNLLPFLTT